MGSLMPSARPTMDVRTVKDNSPTEAPSTSAPTRLLDSLQPSGTLRPTSFGETARPSSIPSEEPSSILQPSGTVPPTTFGETKRPSSTPSNEPGLTLEPKGTPRPTSVNEIQQPPIIPSDEPSLMVQPSDSLPSSPPQTTSLRQAAQYPVWILQWILESSSMTAT